MPQQSGTSVQLDASTFTPLANSDSPNQPKVQLDPSTFSPLPSGNVQASPSTPNIPPTNGSSANPTASDPSLYERLKAMIVGPGTVLRSDLDNPEGPTFHRLQPGQSAPSSPPQTSSLPFIAPTNAMTVAERQAHPIMTGLGEVAGGLTSPDSAAIIAATGGLGSLEGIAGRILPRIVSAGFSASMFANAYKTNALVKAAADRGNVSEVQRLLTHLAADTALGYLAGRHSVVGEGPSAPSKAAPQTTEAAPTTPRGEGTSAVNLVDAPPSTNPSMEIQNQTAEIARLQNIVDDPKAPEEVKDYARKAIQASQDVRASIQNPEAKYVGPREPLQAEPATRPSDAYKQILNSTAASDTSLGPDVQARIETNANLLRAKTSPTTIQTPEDVDRVLDRSAEFLASRTDSRLTQPLTAPLRIQLASELGLTEDEFLNTPIGEAPSPERLQAAQSLLEQSRNRVLSNARDADADPTLVDNFTYALAKHQEIVTRLTADKQEAGRILQTLADASRTNKPPSVDSIADSLSKMPEDAKLEAIRGMSKLDQADPSQMERFAREIKPSSLSSKLKEFWMNGLLSGSAFVAKTGSDLTMEALSSPRKYATAGINFLLSKLTDTPQERFAAEAVVPRLTGFVKGWEVAKTECGWLE
jgi:hypothetical protein